MQEQQEALHYARLEAANVLRLRQEVTDIEIELEAGAGEWKNNVALNLDLVELQALLKQAEQNLEFWCNVAGADKAAMLAATEIGRVELAYSPPITAYRILGNE
jgi:hypothetical protein